jgi:hypothetical protein
MTDRPRHFYVLEAFEDWTSPSAWLFIQRFPSPSSYTRQANAIGRNFSTAGTCGMPRAARAAWSSSPTPPTLAAAVDSHICREHMLEPHHK